MRFSKAALATTALVVLSGAGAVAQPVSGLYVGAGVGANWLIGGEGNVLNRRPGDLLARLLGAPDFATLQRNVAAEARAAEARVEAALAEAARAAARETALQAAADNPALPPAARAVAAQLLPEARAAAAQAATQAIASRGLAQAAQAVSNAATAVQDLSRSAKISFDVGWVGVASLGWGFGNGLRAEVEGNYRTNDVDQVPSSACPRRRAAGSAATACWATCFTTSTWVSCSPTSASAPVTSGRSTGSCGRAPWA
jgi:hypothetical protein